MANITPTYESFPTLQREMEPLRLMREMMRWDPFQAIAPSVFRERVAFTPAFDVNKECIFKQIRLIAVTR